MYIEYSEQISDMCVIPVVIKQTTHANDEQTESKLTFMDDTYTNIIFGVTRFVYIHSTL